MPALRSSVDRMKRCACGCRSTIPEIRTDGKPQRFHVGHGRRGKVGLVTSPESTSESTGRWRAKKLKKRDRCELEHIGSCKGRFEVAHINGRPIDNRADNLLSLCQSHHQLLDLGRINMQKPSMPPFRVDKRGKRRYVRLKGGGINHTGRVASCWIEVECGQCGKKFERRRKVQTNHPNCFCNRTCYLIAVAVNRSPTACQPKKFEELRR